MVLSTLTAQLAWNLAAYHVLQHGCFYSVGARKLTYTAKLKGDTIIFTGTGRNLGPEKINKADFEAAFNKINRLPVVNTNTIKSFLIGSHLYAKRSPFIGLLYSAGVLI